MISLQLQLKWRKKSDNIITFNQRNVYGVVIGLGDNTTAFCMTKMYFDNGVWRTQITQLKIASNPFAKGFRDTEADERKQ